MSFDTHRPSLHRITLHDAMNPGVRSVRITESQPLDSLLAASYAAGWALIEVNDKGEPLRAYRRDLKERVRR
jgi:hypothetical protein